MKPEEIVAGASYRSEKAVWRVLEIADAIPVHCLVDVERSERGRIRSRGSVIADYVDVIPEFDGKKRVVRQLVSVEGGEPRPVAGNEELRTRYAGGTVVYYDHKKAGKKLSMTRAAFAEKVDGRVE